MYATKAEHLECYLTDHRADGHERNVDHHHGNIARIEQERTAHKGCGICWNHQVRSELSNRNRGVKDPLCVGYDEGMSPSLPHGPTLDGICHWFS